MRRRGQSTNVPKDAQVFRSTLIKPADLKVGMQITARGTTAPDGTLVATSITVAAP
ncbi:MAG TPA: hypothetical protein VGK88_00940 [bacterium]